MTSMKSRIEASASASSQKVRTLPVKDKLCHIFFLCAGEVTLIYFSYGYKKRVSMKDMKQSLTDTRGSIVISQTPNHHVSNNQDNSTALLSRRDPKFGCRSWVSNDERRTGLERL